MNKYIGLAGIRAAAQRGKGEMIFSAKKEQEEEALRRHKRSRQLSDRLLWSKILGIGAGIGLAPFTGGMSLGLQALLSGAAGGLTTYGAGKVLTKDIDEIGPGRWGKAEDILAEKEFRRNMENQMMSDAISSMLTGITAPYAIGKLGLSFGAKAQPGIVPEAWKEALLKRTIGVAPKTWQESVIGRMRL